MARQAPKLGRRRHSREPKKRFIIFCEGKNTEPEYFTALGRMHTTSLIGLKLVPAAGVPQTLAKSAISYAKENGLARKSRRAKNSFEEKDEVWAVFDRDDHDGYYDAVVSCEQAGIGVGRSNPCFELWLILHQEDFDKPDDRHAVQAHLKKIRPEYDPDKGKLPDCADLIKGVEDAERRSVTQLGRRAAEVGEGKRMERPYTTVGDLTKAIRRAGGKS